MSGQSDPKSHSGANGMDGGVGAKMQKRCAEKRTWEGKPAAEGVIAFGPSSAQPVGGRKKAFRKPG